jgi:heme exporter protein D
MASGGFWAMGGYAAFVWPAYAVTILALGFLLVSGWRGLRRAERRLAAIEQSRPRRRTAARADRPAGDHA